MKFPPTPGLASQPVPLGTCSDIELRSGLKEGKQTKRHSETCSQRIWFDHPAKQAAHPQPKDLARTSFGGDPFGESANGGPGIKYDIAGEHWVAILIPWWSSTKAFRPNFRVKSYLLDESVSDPRDDDCSRMPTIPYTKQPSGEISTRQLI